MRDPSLRVSPGLRDHLITGVQALQHFRELLVALADLDCRLWTTSSCATNADIRLPSGTDCSSATNSTSGFSKTTIFTSTRKASPSDGRRSRGVGKIDDHVDALLFHAERGESS
jgi:hypothetical protein